jgi:hypothetical protein
MGCCALEGARAGCHPDDRGELCPRSSCRRPADRLAVCIVLALPVGGCSGQSTTSTAASGTSATTSAPTSLAPTTTALPPLTAKGRAWLKAVPRVSSKTEKDLGASSITVTPATMHSFANLLRSCREELLAAGSPSNRLQPVYALVKRACAEHDKGARCFDSAATFNPLGPGTRRLAHRSGLHISFGEQLFGVAVDRPNRRDQRTASTMTSCGKRKPARPSRRSELDEGTSSHAGGLAAGTQSPWMQSARAARTSKLGNTLLPRRWCGSAQGAPQTPA